MPRAGRFVERLPGFVGDRLFIIDPRGDLAFEHISHGGAGVAVGHGGLAGGVVHGEHDGFLARHVGQGVLLQHLERFLVVDRVVGKCTEGGEHQCGSE